MPEYPLSKTGRISVHRDGDVLELVVPGRITLSFLAFVGGGMFIGAMGVRALYLSGDDWRTVFLMFLCVIAGFVFSLKPRKEIIYLGPDFVRSKGCQFSPWIEKSIPTPFLTGFVLRRMHYEDSLHSASICIETFPFLRKEGLFASTNPRRAEEKQSLALGNFSGAWARSKTELLLGAQASLEERKFLCAILTEHLDYLRGIGRPRHQLQQQPLAH
jgi:hypothetical protein